MSDTSYWINFFKDAGLPARNATEYAMLFIDNRITKELLSDLNKDYLNEMGIDTLGDVMLILKHAKGIGRKLNKTRVLMETPSGVKVKQSTPASRTVNHFLRAAESGTESPTLDAQLQRRQLNLSSDLASRLGSDSPTSLSLRRTQVSQAKDQTGENEKEDSNGGNQTKSAMVSDSGDNDGSVFSRLGGNLKSGPVITRQTSALQYEGVLKMSDTKRKQIQQEKEQQIREARRQKLLQCSSACQTAGVLAPHAAGSLQVKERLGIGSTTTLTSRLGTLETGIKSRLGTQEDGIKSRLGISSSRNLTSTDMSLPQKGIKARLNNSNAASRSEGRGRMTMPNKSRNLKSAVSSDSESSDSETSGSSASESDISFEEVTPSTCIKDIRIEVSDRKAVQVSPIVAKPSRKVINTRTIDDPLEGNNTEVKSREASSEDRNLAVNISRKRSTATRDKDSAIITKMGKRRHEGDQQVVAKKRARRHVITVEEANNIIKSVPKTEKLPKRSTVTAGRKRKASTAVSVAARRRMMSDMEGNTPRKRIGIQSSSVSTSPASSDSEEAVAEEYGPPLPPTLTRVSDERHAQSGVAVKRAKIIKPKFREPESNVQPGKARPPPSTSRSKAADTKRLGAVFDRIGKGIIASRRDY